ncbi:MAG: invasion associated locus B family protein [Proteobacteria bacterium]|nr:MAG: invasion associated locus B family protein [Pseudomonadota bacterium]
MFRKLLLSLVAAIAVSIPVHAQDDPDTAPESDEPDVTTSRFRDWALRCRTDAESGDTQCTMFQRLVVQETNRVALNVAIGFLQNEQGEPVPVAVFTFPLGIWLPGGMVLQVDEGEQVPMAIERCFRRGCQTGLALNDDLIGQFKAGNQAKVTIKQSREEDIDLTVSLNGFSAGFNALNSSLSGG